MVDKAIILAAGRGRRLSPLTDYVPKELLEINGKPIIENLVELISSIGISEIQVVIAPPRWDGKPLREAYTGPGMMVNSDIFNGTVSLGKHHRKEWTSELAEEYQLPAEINIRNFLEPVWDPK